LFRGEQREGGEEKGREAFEMPRWGGGEDDARPTKTADAPNVERTPRPRPRKSKKSKKRKKIHPPNKRKTINNYLLLFRARAPLTSGRTPSTP
jgi:hypothetical protein